jgi:LysM repeat protein
MARTYPSTGSQPPSVELTMRQGPQSGQRFSLTQPTIIIGRTAGNDVVVNHPEVSRRHASLTWDGRQFIIQDLGSANGTFVNGVRLTSPQVLQPGDVIGLGQAVLLGFQATLPLVRPVAPPAYAPLRPEPVEGPRPAAPPPARRRGRGRVALPLLAALLGLGCLASIVAGVAIWFYNGQRRQAISDHPLVLIRTPVHREQIPLGESVSTHAMARAESGIARIELWADGTFVTARDNPSGGPTSPLLLNAGWEPNTLGRHYLIVRAISGKGVKGQATVAVDIVEAVAEADTAEHIVQEGETLESIAEDVGVDVEELEDLNPDLDPEGLQPGDVVHYPEEEPAPGGAEEPEREAPPSGAEPPPAGEPPGGAGEPPGGGATPSGGEPSPADEPPPVPHDEAPGSFLYVMEIIGLDGLIPADPGAGEPVGLRAEVLALETDGAYDSLHCYVGLGEGAPRWYPDDDSDQSTAESFASLGGGSWDVVPHLSGGAVPVISWSGDQPLPINILTCVGIIEGSTDPAVELEPLALNVRPEAWDGVTRRAVSEGDEGTFTLDYRVSRVELLPTEPQKWIDHSMTPPTNLRLIHAGAGYFLGWEYEPEEDEALIDGGFRVYLNDTLQWVEPPDSHFTALPSQWVHPPCGDEYRFHITAYYNQDCPDCRESESSNVVTTRTGDPGDPGCGQTVIVTFQTLTTGDLGGDGRYDPGDMGPVYGDFYVNDQLVSFDGRCDRSRCEWGMNHHSEYGIPWLLANHGGGSAQMAVDIPPQDDYAEVGFTITDEETGRNNADDLVCRGEVLLDTNLSTDYTIDTWQPFDAPVDRCLVSVTFRPVTSAPVGEPGGPPPLPNLTVEKMTVQDPGGQLRIHVRNTGLAALSRRDLDVEVVRRSGESLGVYTWPDITLEPGERTVLQQSGLAPERPLDTCAILDPNNTVNEEGEEIEWAAYSYCPPLPDLTITDAEYDAPGDRLLVTVQNVGEAPLEHRNVSLVVTLADGSTLSDRPVWRSDVTVERVHRTTLELAGIGEEQRARMMGGYTVAVDPIDSIAETDEDNNEYVVSAGARLRLVWWQITTHYYPYRRRSDSPQEQTFQVSVLAGRCPSCRYVANWTAGPFEIERGMEGGPWDGMLAGAQHFGSGTDAVEFEIAGDEPLMVNAQLNMKYRTHTEIIGWGGVTLTAEDDWGVGGTISEDEQCGWAIGHIGQWLYVQPHEPWQSCGDWGVQLRICRVE